MTTRHLIADRAVLRARHGRKNFHVIQSVLNHEYNEAIVREIFVTTPIVFWGRCSSGVSGDQRQGITRDQLQVQY